MRLIDFIYAANNLHWGEGLYQWFFYVGLLLIILFEKKKNTKLLFGVLPLIFLLILYNPFSFRFANYLIRNSILYYARMYTFIPLFACMAIGIMQVLKRVKGGMKLALTGLLVVGIGLAGNNFYYAEWMKPAQNIQKVPQSAIDLLKVLPRDKENVCIAFPEPLNIYMRQLDASIMMPYGRDINALGSCLNMSNPDVDTVMSLGGEMATDYVVLQRKEDTLALFADKGHMPCAMTDAYVVYKIEGVPKVVREYNDYREIVSMERVDAAGQALPMGDGYTRVAYEYNANGNCIKETYYDRSGGLWFVNERYCAIARTYYLNGNEKTFTYMDEENRPVLMFGRYTTKKQYDNVGRKKRESYLDENGRLMKRLDTFYAIRDYEYDANGNIAAEYYRDENGVATDTALGYAGVRWAYDQAGMRVSARYFDAEGREIGSVSDVGAANSELMTSFCFHSGHASKDGGQIVFRTKRSGNRFYSVRFQVYNSATGEKLAEFGEADGTGACEGVYRHEWPDGLYDIVFKGGTNLEDEYISCTEYLKAGETLRFRFNLDRMEEQCVSISDFSIACLEPEAG